MEWIIENANLIIVAILLLAPLFKRLFEAKLETLPPPLPPREEPEEDDFGPYENWALPDEPTAPPPPLPLPPVIKTALPALSVDSPDTWQIPRPAREIGDTFRPAKGGRAATMAPTAADRAATAATAQNAASALRNALKNRREIRRALVLREILGPPVGLK